VIVPLSTLMPDGAIRSSRQYCDAAATGWYSPVRRNLTTVPLCRSLSVSDWPIRRCSARATPAGTAAWTTEPGADPGAAGQDPATSLAWSLILLIAAASTSDVTFCPETAGSPIGSDQVALSSTKGTGPNARRRAAGTTGRSIRSCAAGNAP
jgi:hypothetical protein